MRSILRSISYLVAWGRPSSDELDLGVITFGNAEDTNWRHRSVDPVVINLPFWSTLTLEHEAACATTSHHQEAPIFGLTSTNAFRSRPLNT